MGEAGAVFSTVYVVFTIVFEETEVTGVIVAIGAGVEIPAGDAFDSSSLALQLAGIKLASTKSNIKYLSLIIKLCSTILLLLMITSCNGPG